VPELSAIDNEQRRSTHITAIWPEQNPGVFDSSLEGIERIQRGIYTIHKYLWVGIHWKILEQVNANKTTIKASGNT
jgi:hypothetical protein